MRVDSEPMTTSLDTVSGSATIPSFDMMASGVQEVQQPLDTSSHSQRPSVSSSSGPPSDRTRDSGSSPPPSDTTHESVPDSHDGKGDKIVMLPDMFSSIMAVDPVVNPNYFKVKPKGDAWIQWYYKLLITVS